MTSKRSGRSAEDERVSLAPLDPEQALRALLQVDPESEPAKDQPKEGSGADGEK
jgi:hypothetical protein